MGFFKTAIVVSGGLVTYGTYLFVKMGSKAPEACRRVGQRIGLFKLYTKEFLKEIRPETDFTEVLDLYKKADYASTAFKREFSREMFDLKGELQLTLPEELSIDPLEKFRLKSDEPILVGMFF